MADAITTFKVVVKEVADAGGAYATFMPKPLEDVSGSGMHLHLSLFDGERNLFDGGAGTLSSIGRQFLAGVLRHARELTAITNSWINSYKRLGTGFEAPQYVNWTRTGQGVLVRVPAVRPERAEAARLEVRSPDPSCNPYLALEMLLAAGMHGIESEYDLPEESSDDNPDGPRLPPDLREATEPLATSKLAEATLGSLLTGWHLENQRREWSDYQRTVTEFERARYLPVL